jgi:hypothetical protein
MMRSTLTEPTAYVVCALVMGAGATAVIDLWAMVRKRVLGVPSLDYGLVGRWLAYLAQGRFSHQRISTMPRASGERLIGWTAHYLIGIVFAAALLAIWGLEWVRSPTPGPALTVGLVSVAAPFLLLQPGMGLGIAASRTPRPAVARIQTLLTHSIFGAGLYAAAWLARSLAF